MATQASPGVLGRTFVGPAFDYALIGGLLGTLIGFVAYARGFRFDTEKLWLVVLTTSYAHFAASTVRLYSRAESVRRWPFLTLGVPVVTLAITTLLLFADRPTGRKLEGVYLVWSAYHYAAQAFGLAIMYAYRSGCELAPAERRLLRAACLAPFVYGLLAPGSGFSVLAPAWITDHPGVIAARSIGRTALLPFMLGAPLWLAARMRRGGRRTLPLISLSILYTNALWWTFFLIRDAFAWAALSHAIQYIAIVTLFHVKDATATEGNRHGRLYHVITFYAACVALGYALFELLPAAYGAIWIRLDSPVTVRRIALIINIHHFLVDGYIWKLRGDRNLAHVIEQPAAA